MSILQSTWTVTLWLHVGLEAIIAKITLSTDEALGEVVTTKLVETVSALI